MQKNDLYLEGKSFIGKVWDSVPEDIREDTVLKFRNTGKNIQILGIFIDNTGNNSYNDINVVMLRYETRGIITLINRQTGNSQTWSSGWHTGRAIQLWQEENL